jgi:hypothetical protein
MKLNQGKENRWLKPQIACQDIAAQYQVEQWEDKKGMETILALKII